MRGSESRDRQRKMEILNLFKPKKNGIFIHRPRKREVRVRYNRKPGKVKMCSV